tara:strand:+ start:1562 stop:1912 length:351 start_codon:yes stop_codon:yes gene_type:complete
MKKGIVTETIAMPKAFKKMDIEVATSPQKIKLNLKFFCFRILHTVIRYGKVGIAFFRLGVEGCHPDQFQRISKGNLNPLGIDFSLDQWEKKGTFKNLSPQMPSRQINQQFRRLFSL